MEVPKSLMRINNGKKSSKLWQILVQLIAFRKQNTSQIKRITFFLLTELSRSDLYRRILTLVVCTDFTVFQVCILDLGRDSPIQTSCSVNKWRAKFQLKKTSYKFNAPHESNAGRRKRRWAHEPVVRGITLGRTSYSRCRSCRPETNSRWRLCHPKMNWIVKMVA